AAYVAGGVGAAALGVAGMFGWRAFAKWNDRNANCPNSQCDGTAARYGNDADNAANVANVSGAIGVAAIGAGAILWYLSRAPEPSRARSGGSVSLSVAPPLNGTGGGLQVEGRW